MASAAAELARSAVEAVGGVGIFGVELFLCEDDAHPNGQLLYNELAPRPHNSGHYTMGHLPGMVAAYTPLPVIGVPVQSEALRGLDSLLSIVQMPAGVPVAMVAIGGARNAGLLAVQIIGSGSPALQARLLEYKARLADQSRAKNDQRFSPQD